MLSPALQDACPVCRQPSTVAGFVCLECRANRSVWQILSAFEYREPLVEKIIVKLKYEYAADLSGFMAQRLLELWRTWSKNSEDVIVMPIPLHRKRQRERGFNQAELIARVFSRALDFECCTNALVRTRNAVPQVGLSAHERLVNVTDMFTLEDSPNLRGKHILLIDDVITTGATIQEAGRVLAAAGVKKITALTFARG